MEFSVVTPPSIKIINFTKKIMPLQTDLDGLKHENSIIFPPIMSDMTNLLLPSKWRESWVILLLFEMLRIMCTLFEIFLGGN